MRAMHGLAHLSDYMQRVAAAVSGRHPHMQLVIRRTLLSVQCPLLAIVRFRWLEAASGTVCRPTPPQLQH